MSYDIDAEASLLKSLCTVEEDTRHMSVQWRRIHVIMTLTLRRHCSKVCVQWRRIHVI